MCKMQKNNVENPMPPVASATNSVTKFRTGLKQDDHNSDSDSDTESSASDSNSDSDDDDRLPSTETTIVLPLDTHTHTIIFLHGREDFGEDLARYFFDRKSSTGRSMAELLPSTRFVFPTSKMRFSAQRDAEFSPSSFAAALKGEEVISQWFDIWDINRPEFKEELMIPGLRESVEQIVEIIHEEANLVPMKNIILGGISQGCATAVFTLLSSQLDLGGCIGLSSWMPFRHSIERWEGVAGDTVRISRKINRVLLGSSSEDITTDLSKLSIKLSATNVPIFIAHSKDDETVPVSHGRGLYETLGKLGFDVTWKMYEDGGHWIHGQHGVDDMVAFIRKIWDT